MFFIKKIIAHNFWMDRFFLLSGVVCLSMGFSSLAFSAMVHFPDEELASEYVFPIFDNPQAVLDRNVSLTKRFEWMVMAGLRIDEPLYHSLGLSSSVAFYWNEFSGIGVSGLFFMPGLSPTGKKLQATGIEVKKKTTHKETQEIVTTSKVIFFDALLAPRPLFGAFANYYFSPLYGKISVTKTIVFNFSLYSFFGLGMIAFRHNSEMVMNPAGHLGIGQKIYFNRWVGFNVGIDLLSYRGPNPISKSVVRTNNESRGAALQYSQFKKDIFIRFLVRAGLVILL